MNRISTIHRLEVLRLGDFEYIQILIVYWAPTFAVSCKRVNALHVPKLCSTMDHDDPITTFFPGEDSVDLYAVLSVSDTSKLDDIRKAYRRLALKFHPDKHATASESAKAEASLKFQQIGFSYAVLSDDKRRKRYDSTGKTDEGFDLAAGEDGWEAYFEQMFDRVTRGKLDEMKKEYQGL